MSHPNKQIYGFFALTLTAFILGTFGVWMRMLATSFSVTGQVLARSFFASLIIIVILVIKKLNPFALSQKQFRYIVLFGIAFPLSVLAFTASASSIKVSNSLFMLYVGSIVSTAFYGKILFKEQFSPRHIASLIMVFVGLVFFAYPFSRESLSWGLLFGIASGICEGSAHTLRKLMGSIPRDIIVFYQSVASVVVAIIFFAFSQQPLIHNFHPSAIAIAILFAFLLIAMGYLLVYGFSNFDVNLGTVILASELFFAIVINAIFLKEYPTLMEAVGGVLIFGGAIVTSIQIKGKK